MLTAVLMVPSVLDLVDLHPGAGANEYYAWLLALETAMLGVFLSFDIILFYVFFELTLVPLFFLIGIWGGPERRYAARKFFIYTLDRQPHHAAGRARRSSSSATPTIAHHG